jgi:hypothetical protein
MTLARLTALRQRGEHVRLWGRAVSAIVLPQLGLAQALGMAQFYGQPPPDTRSDLVFVTLPGRETLCAGLPFRGSNHPGGPLDGRQVGAWRLPGHIPQTRTDSDGQHLIGEPVEPEGIAPWPIIASISSGIPI